MAVNGGSLGYLAMFALDSDLEHRLNQMVCSKVHQRKLTEEVDFASMLN